MNKEKYEELLLRFAKELHDVGVTEDMKKIVEAQYTRAPNIVHTRAEEVTRKFTYVYDGYEIQATQTINISLKKSKS